MNKLAKIAAKLLDKGEVKLAKEVLAVNTDHSHREEAIQIYVDAVLPHLHRALEALYAVGEPMRDFRDFDMENLPEQLEELIEKFKLAPDKIPTNYL